MQGEVTLAELDRAVATARGREIHVRQHVSRHVRAELRQGALLLVPPAVVAAEGLASVWSPPSAPPSLSTLRASSSCSSLSCCSRRCTPPSIDWKSGVMDSIILPWYFVM